GCRHRALGAPCRPSTGGIGASHPSGAPRRLALIDLDVVEDLAVADAVDRADRRQVPAIGSEGGLEIGPDRHEGDLVARLGRSDRGQEPVETRLPPSDWNVVALEGGPDGLEHAGRDAAVDDAKDHVPLTCAATAGA